jgi:hypothetical protein
MLSRERDAEALAGAPHDVARAGWLAAIEHEVESIGNTDRAFDREARAGFGKIAHEAADHRAITAESDARGLVGLSALGGSALSHWSNPPSPSRGGILGFVDDQQTAEGGGPKAKCKKQCCGHVISPKTSCPRGTI